MAHQHGHSHRHGHPHDRADSERRVLLALVLTGGFMVVEVIGGLAAGSLALLADAGHMLTDTLSLALAFVAFRIGRWPQDSRRTYGYHRFQVLAAFVNGLTLVAIVGWIAIEATRRLLEPVEVLGGLMLAVAVIGLVVNIAAFAILNGGDRRNLNLRGAALHVLADMLGSVAAIVAALVISITGWMPIDPLLSLLVAVLILRSAWMLLRRSGHILLEGAPEWLDEAELRGALVAAVPAVLEVHHVHAWMLTIERPLLTLHARVAPGVDQQEALRAIHLALADRFGIEHATVQIEIGEACPPAGAKQAPA
jgi:cobalt-zinc-cadmium efflux system protein